MQTLLYINKKNIIYKIKYLDSINGLVLSYMSGCTSRDGIGKNENFLQVLLFLHILLS